MTDDSRRDVETTPARNSGTQTELGIIRVCKEVLVEPSDMIQHLATIHCRATIGPQHFLHAVVLAVVDLARSSTSILSIEVNQVADLVDALRILVYENLRRCHSDVRTFVESRCEGIQPARFRLGVVVQQRYKFSIADRESLIVCSAESNVVRITNQLYTESGPVGVVLKYHFRRPVVRSIIHHYDVERVSGPLLRKRL